MLNIGKYTAIKENLEMDALQVCFFKTTRHLSLCHIKTTKEIFVTVDDELSGNDDFTPAASRPRRSVASPIF